MTRPFFAGLLALYFCLAAPAAGAHLLPKQNATLNVIGDKGYLVVALPLSALPEIDDNRDGALSNEEINRHQDDIRQQFTARFSVKSNDGPAPMAFAWISNPEELTLAHAEDDRVPTYMVIMAGAQFRAVPKTISIETDLFGTAADEQQFTLRARRDKQVEVAILTPQAPQQNLFEGGGAIFARYVRLGIEHILRGYDHLLFLLTIIVAGAGWRYWLTVTTSFTIAHSLTLTLAALGLVNVSAALVEPAIALSIALVAALNLYGRAHQLGLRAAIVFACGLLHGLGFASALGSIGLATGHRVITLAGFNIGVELGQGLFLLLSLLAATIVGRMVRRWSPQSFRPAFGARAASMTALVAGLAMLADHMVPGLLTNV